MIGRLRGRENFEQLARHGTRVSHPPLWCSWCPSIEGPNVGFALTRAVGNAVTRNRLRRRLRSILLDLDRADPLPPINLLIGARPTKNELTFAQLRITLGVMIDEIRSRT